LGFDVYFTMNGINVSFSIEVFKTKNL